MTFLKLVASFVCVLVGGMLLMGGVMSPKNMTPIVVGVFFCAAGVLIWRAGKKRVPGPPVEDSVLKTLPHKGVTDVEKPAGQSPESETAKIQIQRTEKDDVFKDPEDWEGVRVAMLEDSRLYQRLFAEIYEGAVRKELRESGMTTRQVNKFLRHMSAGEHQPRDGAHYCNSTATAEFCPPDFVWHRLKIVDGICAREGFPPPAITSSSPALKQWHAFLRFVRASAQNSADASKAFLMDRESTARLYLSGVRREDLPTIAFFQKNVEGLPPYFPEDGVSMGTSPSGGRKQRKKSMWDLEAEVQGVILEFPLKKDQGTYAHAHYAEWMKRMGKV